jgi:hypothetical protein
MNFFELATTVSRNRQKRGKLDIIFGLANILQTFLVTLPCRQAGGPDGARTDRTIKPDFGQKKEPL